MDTPINGHYFMHKIVYLTFFPPITRRYKTFISQSKENACFPKIGALQLAESSLSTNGVG